MATRAWFLTCLFWLFAGGAVYATPPNVILKAEFIEPTTRYDHGILGDAIEWGALKITVDMGCQGCATSAKRVFVIRLPETRVFEDIEPRLVNLGEEPGPSVMVVETDLAKGARLSIYSETGLVTATPFIGRTHRWLAPIGAADLDGDGQVEIAYIDRPHLAKTLRVWRFVDNRLVLVAEHADLTNHRIGESQISGGIRECGQGPELITVNGTWTQVMATRLVNGRLKARSLGPFKGAVSLQKSLACLAL